MFFGQRDATTEPPEGWLSAYSPRPGGRHSWRQWFRARFLGSLKERRSFTRSLRFRLALWNALAVLLTGVVTLLTIREGVRYTLLSELDEFLLDDMHIVQLRMRQFQRGNSQGDQDQGDQDQGDQDQGDQDQGDQDQGDQDQELLRAEWDRQAQGHTHHPWFVQTFDAAGRPLWSSVNSPSELLPISATQELASVSVAGYRVLQQRPELPMPRGRLIRVGISLESHDKAMRHLDWVSFLACGGILLVAPVGGYWLAGQATRPLAQIIHTTSRLRPADLDQRLPLRNTGDELDLLSQTINGLLNRMAAYLGEKRDFLANAAHELRSPLAAIRSAGEVSLAVVRTPEEYQEILSDIVEETASLSHLVNQLLLLAETEGNMLKTYGQRVAWDEIVRQAVEMFRPVAENRDQILKVQTVSPIQIEGDRHQLRQVINNLLDNAIKFTPRGGRVTVDLTCAPRQGEAVLVVRDTGVGIPADDMPHLFQRFFRGNKARSRGGETRGTGLGLSICHAVVVAHRGQIAATSHPGTGPGTGTAFTVTLPLAPASGEPVENSADLRSGENRLAKGTQGS